MDPTATATGGGDILTSIWDTASNTFTGAVHSLESAWNTATQTALNQTQINAAAAQKASSQLSGVTPAMGGSSLMLFGLIALGAILLLRK